MAVDLLTNVIIGGQTTAGFNALAGKLQSLGATVDKIGGYVRDFEKESVEIYRSYEDNMLAAEYALSAQYTSANELSKVMENLDLYASDWAASTIFHTSDVSKAINEAAHAGWDYQKIVEGIPQAMLIAQAGSLDLSTGLDYLVKMMNTTNTEFDDMGTVIDQWAKAANMSATGIGEMGDAFMSLSASAMFADSTQELFTMLAVLANAGVTGTQAGTMLRGAMMRIVAPTEKAKEAMAELGATEEELSGWTEKDKTAETLEQLGFSAYDASGNLKPVRDILTGLHDALAGMDEQGRYDILSSIFPLRTINAATAFYNAIENGKMDELFTAIGDSEGYAAKGADIMMSGLTGSVEELKSKWEEFQKSVGETLAPWIEKVADNLGNIMDAVNSMDETELSALVGSMTTLAGLGPAMMGAGGIVKAVSMLGAPGTAILITAMGVGALVGGITKLNELDLESNFGNLTLDLDTLGEHVDSLKTKFDLQQDAISTWEKALEDAETQYAQKSSALAETMLMDVLTGKKLTSEEEGKIETFAEGIHTAVMKGLENAQARDMSLLEMLFGDPQTVEEDETGNEVAQVMENWYSGLYGEAEAIGQNIRAQMSAALQDHTLDAAEQQAIQASIDRYNQIMAAIQSAMDSESYYAQQHKAQRVSWDSISEYMSENAEKLAADKESLNEAHDREYGRLMTAYDYAIENGQKVFDFDGQEYEVTEASRDRALGLLDEKYAGLEKDIEDKYANLDATAFDTLMNDSGMGMAWNYLKYLNQNGILGAWDADDTNGLFREQGMTPEIAQQLLPQLETMFSRRGDLAGLLEPFADDESIGGILDLVRDYSKDARDQLRDYMSRSQDFEEGGYDEFNEFSTPQERALAEAQKNLASLQEKQSEITAEIAEREDRLANPASRPLTYGLFNGESTDQSALYGEYYSGAFHGGGLYDQQQQVNLDIAAAEAEVARLQGEVNALSTSETVSVVATLDSSAVDNYTPPTKRMTVTPFVVGGAYAEGGRADVPSIFGEAGPEWAIPEEHSERTAELLNRAREASGFTWGDLIERYGGLNANPSHQTVTVNYSPTINAQNAEGVADVLAADKARLLKLVKDMLDEQRFRDEVEVYA